MDREINIDSILALEEQIREHERTTIKLKRHRNSLLNVSKLPPEVLANIFHWNVTFKGDFSGLEEGSHNFLLVCHHWFEVASRTPEIWSFWGNTPDDWGKWCHRSETAPLDLVLDGGYYGGPPLDITLHNVLQDRATRDTIRRVHLVARDTKLLKSIIAPLTSNYDELRSNDIRSFVLSNNGRGMLVDVSDFFAHYRFPKLQYLDLFNCTISSWDYLTTRTSALTTLILSVFPPSPIPTTSQILSILASNPALRKVKLVKYIALDDDGSGSSFRVLLRHLKELQLEGDFPYVVRLLHQLDHPGNLEGLFLSLYGCEVMDISQTIGPYLRDYLQRHDKTQNGLALRVFSIRLQAPLNRSRIVFHAGDVGGVNFSAPDWSRINTFVTVDILVKGTPRKSVSERAALDLITYPPPEEVVYLHACNASAVTEDTYTQFPNIRALSFDSIPLSAAFPNPNLIGDGEVFSLQHILLKRVVADCGAWTPLTTFLACRVSSGNRLDTLEIADSSHMCLEVMDGIRDMVQELVVTRLNPVCPFNTCPEP